MGNIMVVMAHPDDCELSCAASIAKWVREGDTATLVLATDGARGAKYEGPEGARVAEERAAEQREAAGVIGFKDMIFLGFPDGDLTNDIPLRGALVREIRRLQPDVAVFMDPLTVIYRNYYVNHRDHRELGMAMLDALYPEASNAAYFPEQIAEGLPLHKVPEVLLATTDQPNFWVDVTNTLSLRFEALRRHRSQMKLWPDDGDEVIRQQRELSQLIGLEHGMGAAEAFRRVVVNPLN